MLDEAGSPLDYAARSGSIQVTAASVPEPSTLSMGLVGAIAVVIAHLLRFPVIAARRARERNDETIRAAEVPSHARRPRGPSASGRADHGILGTGRARGIAAGPGGDLWFTLADDQIGRITPDGQVATFSIPPSYGGPTNITAGPDGNLWFTYAYEPGIGRITPEGQFTAFAAGTSPTDIIAGPDGNLWFTDAATDAIGRITPTGELTEFSMPTSQASPMGITAGPDGNLWFTERNGGKIGRVTPDGAFTEFSEPGFAVDIAAGADGNLWFTSASGLIYRITTAGESTVFPLPPAQNFESATRRPIPASRTSRPARTAISGSQSRRRT